MIDLTGKVVLVTGGSRGIGRATCVLAARAGADVVIGYKANRAAAAAVVTAVEAAGRSALAVAGDLSKGEDAHALFETAHDRFGHLDIVVVNAGVWEPAPIETMTEEQWRRTMTANLDSAYHVCHLAAAHMKPRRSGKLILVTSTAGQRGEACYSHYAASKGAMIAMTRSLGSELGPYGINVNAVAPGWVATDMTTEVFGDPARKAAIEREIPLRRIAGADDIAGPILFLASDLARHLQGSVLSVNGGSVMA